MPPKARIPAPIDRPLSRAYLRNFTGWSTAYPPGLSDPTSLRVMENVMTRRDGAVAVRPGLRYLSYVTPPLDGVDGVGISEQVVGTHEAFFLNDGTKAYLFAVREADGTVGFRVVKFTDSTSLVYGLTDAAIGFTVPQTEAVLNFTSNTTYVKYLQIDNKIFALSNAGETMRLFTVGTDKTARKLSSIERPDWSVVDKLTAVEPDAAWISAGVPTSIRTNLVVNPSAESNTLNWETISGLLTRRLYAPGAHDGDYVFQLESKAQRTNLCPSPLHNVAAYGTAGWGPGTFAGPLTTDSGYLRVNSTATQGGTHYYANGPVTWNIQAGQSYVVALDYGSGGFIGEAGVLVRFYNSSGVQVGGDLNYSFGAFPAAGRKVVGAIGAPAGAVGMAIFPWATQYQTSGSRYFLFKNVTYAPYTDGDWSILSGDSGTNYFWTGATNASASVYHPPAAVAVRTDLMSVAAALSYAASIYARAVTTGRSVTLQIEWFNSSGSSTGTSVAVVANDASGSWTRFSKIGSAPAGTTKARLRVDLAAIPRGELHYLDSALFEQSSSVDTFFDGATPDSSPTIRAWAGTPNNSTSTETVYSVGTTVPAAETATANTLISSDPTKNIYSFGFFYTISNEIGESAASQITVVRAQRPWSGWKWETANATGEPSGTKTDDPTQCADQLIAYMPQAVFDAAIAQGAVKWNLYMLTWSDQDPVPVEGVLVDQRKLDSTSLYGTSGWGRVTPQFSASSTTSVVPKNDTRHNYSDPSRGGQGLVAADRMVMVYDPTAAAVIRWTSNRQGDYTDFTASKGGGYKTLTSGNLLIPACVKLWQNPQSVDTLTILCLGTDGYSTGYYMAPAQVASQSEATNIMGFEETTATPGTTSPYGCEVANNALFHPLDEQLMKSTATNYNINHSSMTDLIRNRWVGLRNKQDIISAQHDNRLYYVVYNPQGELLEDGCNGNEIWVLDISKEGGNSWSRWLVQAHSLRKIEQGGHTYMSVVRPDGIFYLDPLADTDDVVDPTTRVISQRYIPWSLETNTQGANRAHDAWAHVQQANIVVGNFLGQMRYGVRGIDLHGKPVTIEKVLRDPGTDDLDSGTWDLEDYLLIRRDMKEWFFYASSVEQDGVTQHSSGQICLVQYRYTPSTVNTGYEFGSVETFEYGRAGNAAADRTTDNGVPMPFIETGRP